MSTTHRWLVAALLAGSVVAVTTSANAACTKLAFSVNDYGKTGPAADAQALLDKFIARWAKEQGISKYTTSKKNVDCELYLDVGLFDEYTCKATASVCWGATSAAEAQPSGTEPQAPRSIGETNR